MHCNQYNKQKKTTKPTQSIFVWFLACPWTLRNVLCSVLHTVNSWSRHSTIVCLGLFQQLLLLLLSFFMVLSRSHIFHVFSEIQLSCNRKPFPKPSTCFSWMVYYPFSGICSLYTNGSNKLNDNCKADKYQPSECRFRAPQQQFFTMTEVIE